MFLNTAITVLQVFKEYKNQSSTYQELSVRSISVETAVAAATCISRVDASSCICKCSHFCNVHGALTNEIELSIRYHWSEVDHAERVVASSRTQVS